MREQIKVFTQEKNRAFQIEIAGKSWCDGTYMITRPLSRIWVLEYILSGKGTVEVTDHAKRTYEPKAGDVYLLPPGKRHHYYADAQEPWEKIFVNFSGTVADGLAQAYGIDETVYFPMASETEDLFREMDELLNEEGLEEAQVARRMELLIHDVFRSLGRRQAVQRQESEEIETVIKYLDAHVDSLVSIGELSDLIYRSPDYLIKHFKAEVGVTPYRYLMKRKIQVAEKLLKDTALPVGEIAARLGYEDAHYFSGLFKKEKGVSPITYRRGERL